MWALVLMKVGQEMQLHLERAMVAAMLQYYYSAMEVVPLFGEEEVMVLLPLFVEHQEKPIFQ
jgi:hypothetical protein